MTGDLSKDWFLYVLGALMIGFFTFVIIKGNEKPKDNDQELWVKPKDKDQKK